MKFSFSIFLCLIVTFSFAQTREVLILQNGWKFAPGANDKAYEVNFNDQSWKEVTVPHDWAIAGPFIENGDGNTAKLPWKGEGWYRYQWKPSTAFASKQIYLMFDGVMSFPTIYVNGVLAGKWDYGYNSFYLDITAFIKTQETNVIAVHVDTRQHDSRWYPGAGIFRKVQLIAMNPIHASVWGTQITTPILKSNYAQVEVVTKVDNKSASAATDLTIEHRIISPNGNIITVKLLGGDVSANSSKTFRQTFVLNHPDRWDVDHGVLYTLKTYIKQDYKIIDGDSSTFGVRSVRFTADDGLYINDKRVQLKGVCLHHDQGALGAAFYPRAMERQLEIMKSMGVNAIRTSHNVPAPELLEMCDQMGLLVMDEIFDKYDRKADILDTTDFESFAQRNVSNFVRRDRNHPCIFLWSVGNEIGDVQWNQNGGFDKLRTMVNEVRRNDPSRTVTLVCDSRNSAKLRHFDFYDVHSWNYGRRYDLARQLEPNKAVIISESASTVSTRGFYEWPLPKLKTDFTKSLQVSSYDLNAPDWAEIADDDFMWQQDENYVAGEFVWTGFDYLGEPTPYENAGVKKLGLTDQQASVSSYFGAVDLMGIPKDRYFLYKSYWNTSDTTIHILPHWNWPGKEGDTIPVFVYTSGDCAELFVNGISQGMKCKKPDSSVSTERFRLMWNDVVYKAGEVKAVAYREGVAIGEEAVKTSGKPVRIKLTPDRIALDSDGLDLCYVLIEAVDDAGRINPVADAEIDITVTGSGSIAGIGNGDPQSMKSFQSNHVKLFYGKAMLIVKSGMTSGPIQVVAKAKGLAGAEVTLLVK